jgi:peroxiredoxin
MALNVGDNAPDFTLKNTAGEDVTLSDAHQDSNVVLLFFPLAFTGVCTKEMCHMRDNLSQFEDLDAQVFGISVDSFFTLKQFKESEDLNFPLLSDFNKEVASKYETIYEEFFDMKGVAKRSAYVIDQDGVIQYAEVLDDAGNLPDFDAIQAALS